MIKNNFRIIMAKNEINSLTEAMKVTELSRNSLNKLWHNKNLETIKLETLMKICDTFDVTMDELITYKPGR